MVQQLFIVDVEASGSTPVTGEMTEFAAVHFPTGAWFHGHLWNFTPDPDIPALPVLVGDAPAPGYTTGPAGTAPGDLEVGPRIDVGQTTEVFEALSVWLSGHGGPGDRIVFVSDNPAFDFMWMACGFDTAGIANPFGHTGRRIGDLAAGLPGQWRNTSAWKRHRRTVHDHNPVRDALGNLEGLAAVLEAHGQPY